MSSGLRTSGALLGLLAVLLAGGTHWLVLQSVAWGQMLIAYSQHDSFRQAVTKTFDGRHPCSLCLQVQRGQSEGRKHAALLPLERQPDLQCGPERVGAPFPPRRAETITVFVHGLRDDFVPEPPTPPPKGA
jgi:hypothetical protein